MKIRFKPERAFSATPNSQCPGAGLFSIPILPSCFDHLPVINCSMSLGTLDFYCWPWASPQSGHQKVFGRVPFFSPSLSFIWNWVTWPKCTAKLALSVGFGLFAARQVCFCVCRPGKYKFDIIFQRQLQAASYIEWKCSPICLSPEMHWHLGAWPRRSDFCGFNFAEWRMKFPLLFCAFLWLFFTIPQSFWGWKKLEKNIKLKFHVLYWLDLIWVKQVKGIWFLLHFKLLTWLGKFHLLGTILYFFQYCKYYIY